MWERKRKIPLFTKEKIWIEIRLEKRWSHKLDDFYFFNEMHIIRRWNIIICIVFLFVAYFFIYFNFVIMHFFNPAETFMFWWWKKLVFFLFLSFFLARRRKVFLFYCLSLCIHCFFSQRFSLPFMLSIIFNSHHEKYIEKPVESCFMHK